MQTASEIRNNLENIKYYKDEIKKLIEKQIDRDTIMAVEKGIGAEYINGIRGQQLAVAYQWASEIEFCLDCIDSNIKSCETQDKIFLNIEPEKTEQETLL